MRIEYTSAPDVEGLVQSIVSKLGFYNIDCKHLKCLRSKGSRAKYTIARIHGLSKIWQRSLAIPAYYVIEVISERYDQLNEREKEETIIHELLHIPKSFGGGFKPHKGWIDRDKVSRLHKIFKDSTISN